jgi:hypothetical protein
MQKEVGLKGAEALAEADLKVFAGGDSSKNGFDLGALIESLNVSNESAAMAALNRIARPNDLGLAELGEAVKEIKIKKAIEEIKPDKDEQPAAAS